MTLTFLNKIERPYNRKFLKMTTNIESTEAKKLQDLETTRRPKTFFSVFHHLPSVGLKQLCALAYLGYNHEVGTF